MTEKTSSHRKLKRDRDKNYEKSVIKTGLRKFCTEPLLVEMIEKAVVACSQVSWEASMFASFHVLRCLENDLPIESLGQTFWNQCIMTMANGRRGPPDTVDHSFMESYVLYDRLRPSDYQPVRREPFMGHIFEGLRETLLTNFETVFSETFQGRLCRWIRLQILESDRENLKDSATIKSAVTLLKIACTNEGGSVQASLPPFKRLESLDADDAAWMQQLVDTVRSSIGGPLPLDMYRSATIPLYFPFLRQMLRDIERHIQTNEKAFRGIKTFSMLPQKKFRAPFIHISTTVLKCMLQSLRGRKKANADEYADPSSTYIHYLLDVVGDDADLWKECFAVKSIGRGRKHFAHSIKTDGISVSATVEIPRAGDPMPSKGHKRKKAVKQREKEATVVCRENVLRRCQESLPDRIVAIDPGCNAPFTGVVYDARAVCTVGDVDKVPFETVQWSSGKYQHERGNAYRNWQMRRWTEACPDLKTFNQTIPTAKTASLDAYSDRISTVLHTLPLLMDFYVHKRRVRRCRWHSFMKHQRSIEQMVADITGTASHHDQEDVLVAYGNASLNNVRGAKPVLQQGLRRRLRRRCLFVDIDEFRTSKLCCSCLCSMRGKMMKTGTRSYKVRHCENSACHRTFWNRDVNASINILVKLLRFLDGDAEPEEFSRETMIHS